jgi:hypothetical protein
MRRTFLIIATTCVSLMLVAFSGLLWLEANSTRTLLNTARLIRPHASASEVTQVLGPADYSIQAPDFPPWLQKSAVGGAKQGTVLVYTISRFQPKLLIIHLLPDSGVQFVTWEPT